MVNNIVNIAPGSRPDPKVQVDPGKEDNFSHYLDKKVETERRERNSLVGVRNQVSSKDNDNDRKSGAKNDSGANDEISAEAFLQQLLADLQDLVKKPGTQPGQWSFQLKSMRQLDQLAEQAGMNPADLAQLKKQMDTSGTVNLADLFATFEKYFQALQQPKEVTAPETDLPMLESLLSRMGVDAGTLSKLSDQSVNDQGQFDLAAYLQGLDNLQDDGSLNLKPVKMSDFEFEQFSSMLNSAGASKGQIFKMFPEKIAAWQQALSGTPGTAADNQPAAMTLDRLKGILAQTISDVKASKPEVNLPGFLQKLSDVLGQAGFVKQGVGWSPVVQDSLTKVYQGLQKMVDLAKVKVDKTNEIMANNKELADQWLASGKASELTETASDGTVGKSTADETAAINSKIADMKAANDKVPDKDTLQDSQTILTSNQDAGQINRASQDLRAQNLMRPQSPQVMQQFVMDQLSQGVIQGLQRDEHHLTLTMYPKELGEVKVDLQVRNNQIAVSFVMDNHKVKHALEKNMSEFKDNLTRQGYSLEACAVMVGQQQNNSDDTKQRFESAWEDMMAAKNASPDGNNTKTGEILASLLQGPGLSSNRWPDSSISFFV